MCDAMVHVRLLTHIDAKKLRCPSSKIKFEFVFRATTNTYYQKGMDITAKISLQCAPKMRLPPLHSSQTRCNTDHSLVWQARTIWAFAHRRRLINMALVKVNRVPQGGWAMRETKAYIDTSKPEVSPIVGFILCLSLEADGDGLVLNS